MTRSARLGDRTRCPPMMRGSDIRVEECPGRWWLLHTKPRNEKALAQDLHDRGLNYFLPLVTAARRYGRRRVELLIPLFPGYLFLTCLSDDERFAALATSRVARMININDQACIRTELEQLRRVLTAGKKVDLYPSIKRGRCCRVMSGSLKGLEGVVTTRRNNGRIFLSVHTLGQSAIVDVDVGCLEPID